MSRPIIAVTGATGMQGGSVVRYLAKDGRFAIRALTRNPTSEKAKQLEENYPEIELVQASLDDPASLKEALKGVYGVFGVTNFWEHGDDGETRQGMNLVDAAKENGVQHFVWSTLDNGDPAVPHFISKWKVDGSNISLRLADEEYLKESGVPRTSLYTGFYHENFYFFATPKQIKENTYILPLIIPADAPIFCYPAQDTGAWVTAIFTNTARWLNQDMHIVTEWLSMRQMAEIMSKVTGKKVLAMEPTEEEFEKSRYAQYPGAEDIYLNMLFFVKHGPDSGIRDQKMTFEVYPEAKTFEQVVRENQDKLFPQ